MLKKIVVLVVGIINIFLWANLWYKFFFNNLLTNSIYTKSDSEIAKVLYLLLLYLFCKGIVMINIGLQIIIIVILIKGHLRNQPYQISKKDFKLITIKNMCILVLIGGIIYFFCRQNTILIICIFQIVLQIYIYKEWLHVYNKNKH